MTTPSITPAQAKADAVLILGVAGALGLKLDGQTSTWLTVAVIAAASVAHLVSYFMDTRLRTVRALTIENIVRAKLAEAQKDPVATAEQVEKIVAAVFKAIDAQSATQAPTTIPVVEAPAPEFPSA